MSALYDNMQVIAAVADFDQPSISFEKGDSLRKLPGRRDVFKARLVDQQMDVVVKCYYPHAKQARDWKNEWDGLQKLQALNLPAPKPLTVCRSENDDICVLMEFIESAKTLGDFLELASVEERALAMNNLAQLVDRLHGSGARQSDQHIDNWAISNGDICLLDAGTFQFKEGALELKERIMDLSAICATLLPNAEMQFRKCLEEQYWIGGGDVRSKLLGEDLEASIVQLQQERVRRYYKKTQRTCTEFGKWASPNTSGMYSKEADSIVVEKFFTDPEALLSSGDRLKSGNTCTVQRIELRGRRYVLKRYNVKPFFTQFRRSLSPSRAGVSWSNGWVLNLAFIPTAKPVAFLDLGGFPRGCSYLLMEAIEGQLLPDYVAKHSHSDEIMNDLVESIGRVWDALQRLRAAHGDLKVTNWMLSAEGKVFLFDLDSFGFGLSDPAYQRGRLKDMNRFLKDWESYPNLAAAFRQRMLGGCPA